MVIAEVKLKLASRKDVYEKVVYFGVEDGDILSVIQHLKYRPQSYPGGGGCATTPNKKVGSGRAATNASVVLSSLAPTTFFRFYFESLSNCPRFPLR